MKKILSLLCLLALPAAGVEVAYQGVTAAQIISVGGLTNVLFTGPYGDVGYASNSPMVMYVRTNIPDNFAPYGGGTLRGILSVPLTTTNAYYITPSAIFVESSVTTSSNKFLIQLIGHRASEDVDIARAAQDTYLYGQNYIHLIPGDPAQINQHEWCIATNVNALGPFADGWQILDQLNGNVVLASTVDNSIVGSGPDSAHAVTFSAGNLATTGYGAFSNGIITTVSNKLAPTAISPFPNTTVPWTNTIGVNIEVYIDNATVTGTAIKKNGATIFTIITGPCTIGLQPGEYFSETYTVNTPTAKWSPR